MRTRRLKTAIVSVVALLATVGAAQAQEREVVDVDVASSYETNLEPGYGQMIEGAPVPLLDEAVALNDEHDKINNFMSHEGLYRYAYYEKTGIWLSVDSAEDEMEILEW